MLSLIYSPLLQITPAASHKMAHKIAELIRRESTQTEAERAEKCDKVEKQVDESCSRESFVQIDHYCRMPALSCLKTIS